MDKKKNILIVDDDSSTLEILLLILNNAGYEVTLERDGKNMLQPLNTIPDIILLDNSLPGTCGTEICRHLKKQESTKHVPVIFISAEYGLEDIALRACADGFIAKPFGMKELLQKLESVLQPEKQIFTAMPEII